MIDLVWCKLGSKIVWKKKNLNSVNKSKYKMHFYFLQPFSNPGCTPKLCMGQLIHPVGSLSSATEHWNVKSIELYMAELCNGIFVI